MNLKDLDMEFEDGTSFMAVGPDGMINLVSSNPKITTPDAIILGLMQLFKEEDKLFIDMVGEAIKRSNESEKSETDNETKENNSTKEEPRLG